MMKKPYKRRRKSTDVKRNQAPLKIVLRLSSGISKEIKMAETVKKENVEIMNEYSSVPSKTTSTEDSSTDVLLKRKLSEDSIDRPRRATKKFKSENALTLSLKHLHQILIKKDKEQFFQYPITDLFAPGYSKIVSDPMDFSTMLKKIKKNEYRCISEYRDDFTLMCNNALLYNKRDTVYYRRAEKLLLFGTKILSRERISSMCKSLEFMSKLTRDEIGDLAPIRKPDTNKESKIERSKQATSKCGFSCTQDSLTIAEVLEQSKRASENAFQRLNNSRPNCRMGFLRVQEDGSTSFTFITGSESREEMTLGDTVGPLESGTNLLPFYREERRNIIRPGLNPNACICRKMKFSLVNGLDYGAYGSNGPDHDSSFASMTKEDSNTLLSVYGSDLCDAYTTRTRENVLVGNAKMFTASTASYYLQYTCFFIIRDYVSGCNGFLTDYVDSVLNGLTNGEHGRQKQTEAETTNKESRTTEVSACTKELNNSDNQLIEQILLETNSLILELNSARNKRLSQNPGVNGTLRNSIPTDTETCIAKSVQEKLTGIIKHTQPGDIVSAHTIHKALGINVNDE